MSAIGSRLARLEKLMLAPPAHPPCSPAQLVGNKAEVEAALRLDPPAFVLFVPYPGDDPRADPPGTVVAGPTPYPL
jgi:hypothetical protein